MKSKEELNELKKEVESVNEKLQELTPEELEQVNGGNWEDHIQESKEKYEQMLKQDDNPKCPFGGPSLPPMIYGGECNVKR